MMTSHHPDIPLRLIIDHYDGCLMIFREDVNTNGCDGHITSVLFSLELNEMLRQYSQQLKTGFEFCAYQRCFISSVAQRRSTIDLCDCLMLNLHIFIISSQHNDFIITAILTAVTEIKNDQLKTNRQIKFKLTLYMQSKNSCTSIRSSHASRESISQIVALKFYQQLSLSQVATSLLRIFTK